MSTKRLKYWYQYNEVKFLLGFAVIIEAMLITICVIAVLQPQYLPGVLLFAFLGLLYPTAIAKDLLKSYRMCRWLDICSFIGSQSHNQYGADV